jgi:CRP-like cAMP-binding protein
VLSLTQAALSFPDGLLPPNHLYWVLAGNVRLFWLGESGRSVTVFTHSVGDVFGELQCGLLDTPIRSLGLLAEAVVTRKMKNARLLEVGPSTVKELLQNDALRCRLERAAMHRSLSILDLARFRLLRESVSAIAHLCVSACCGSDLVDHEGLWYGGARLVVAKTTTLDDLGRLAGVSEGTVRTCLGALKRAGYIRTTPLRFKHTRIEVVHEKAALLVDGLESGALDVNY